MLTLWSLAIFSTREMISLSASVNSSRCNNLKVLSNLSLEFSELVSTGRVNTPLAMGDQGIIPTLLMKLSLQNGIISLSSSL